MVTALAAAGVACASILGVEDAEVDTTLVEGGAGPRSADGALLAEGSVPVGEPGSCVGQGCPCNGKADCKDSVYKECVGNKCVECTTDPDTCPIGSYCLAQGNTCAPGCNSDKACETLTGALAKFCAIERHQCVQCKVSPDCPITTDTCTPSGVCAKRCEDGEDCTGGQFCCPATQVCVDLNTDPLNCGACGVACTGATNQCCARACVDPLTATANCGKCGTNCNTTVRNANGVGCAGGKCTFQTCQGTFANCDNDKANGCECTCPSQCTSCANGICTIDCGQEQCQSGKTCPPGLPCKIRCSGVHACQGTITCAVGQPCTIECSGAQAACDGLTLNRNSASSLCLACKSVSQTPSCNNVACSNVAPCSRDCEGTSGDNCRNACPACTTSVAECTP